MTQTGNCSHGRHHTCIGGGTWSKSERTEIKSPDGKPSGKFRVETSKGTYICDCDCHRIIIRHEAKANP